MTKIDLSHAVRMVDNWRESEPGTIDEKKLIEIGYQKERRRLKRWFGHKVKHRIYRLEGTEEIWYKQKRYSQGVVKMGISLKRKGLHPKSVPMEFYWEVFSKPRGALPIDLLRLSEEGTKTITTIGMTSADWLKLNDYVVVG